MATATDTETNTQIEETTQLIPPWNVVLVDDDEHSYEYVIEMLGAVFGMSEQRAYMIACEVDAAGRAILITTSREHAELKQQQAHAFGPDPRVKKCKGAMTVEIEPA